MNDIPIDPEPVIGVSGVPSLDIPKPTRAQVVHHGVESAQKALAVDRVIVRQSEHIGELMSALAKAQSEFGSFEKTQTANAGKYSYEFETLADVLRSVRPSLSKHGIAVMQFPFTTTPTSVLVRTMLAHGDQWIYSDITTAVASADPQSIGSGISYLRRYALKSILGLAAENDDDDGAMATGRRDEPRRESPKPAQRKSEQAVDPSITVTGTVANIEVRQNAVLFTLSGHPRKISSTRELADTVRSHAGLPVTARIRPSADPTKYADALIGLVPAARG